MKRQCLKATVIVCLVFLWVAGSQTIWAAPKQQSQEVQLVYSESKGKSVRTCGGGSLVGEMDCVSEQIDSSESGETSSTLAQSKLELTLTPYLQITDDNTHIVTVKIRGSSPTIDGNLKSQSKNDIWDDTIKVKKRLKKWSLTACRHRRCV